MYVCVCYGYSLNTDLSVRLIHTIYINNYSSSPIHQAVSDFYAYICDFSPVPVSLYIMSRKFSFILFQNSAQAIMPPENSQPHPPLNRVHFLYQIFLSPSWPRCFTYTVLYICLYMSPLIRLKVPRRYIACLGHFVSIDYNSWHIRGTE